MSTHRAAEPGTPAPTCVPPPDIATMRATTDCLLDPDSAPDVLPPGADEVDTLTVMLRGHLELLTPEVEEAARKQKESIPHYCALACVGEARERLRAEPRPGPYGAVAYARRLARVLNALCDHHDNLVGGPRARL